MYSRTAEYAFCVLGRLASKPGVRQQAGQLAADLQLPEDYVAKLLQRLRQEGIVASHRGRGGGFELARDPASLSLLEISEILDGAEPEERTCVLAGGRCSDEADCVLHRYQVELRRTRARMLGGLSVADLVRRREDEEGRKPEVEP